MKTVLLLRHADVDPPPGHVPDTWPLNPAGRERAAALLHVAGNAGVSAIFVSPALRTQQTVAPLAARLGIATTQTPPSLQDFVQEVLSDATGDVVLVAGHSNTVPQMIDALGAPSPGSLLQGHDDLFIVTVTEEGEAHVARLRYGAPTP